MRIVGMLIRIVGMLIRIAGIELAEKVYRVDGEYEYGFEEYVEVYVDADEL